MGLARGYSQHDDVSVVGEALASASHELLRVLGSRQLPIGDIAGHLGDQDRCDGAGRGADDPHHHGHRTSDLDDPSVWDRLQLSLPRPEARPRSVPPPSSERDTVHLGSITVRNVRVFEELLLALDVPADNEGQCVVIIGENGTGKTSLLRSLVLALTDISNPTEPTSLPTEAFATAWRRQGVDVDTASDIQVNLRGTKHRTEIRLGHGKERFLQDRTTGRPPLFAYGCRRGSALGGAARKVAYEPGDEIATLFSEGASLIHAETWLTLRHAAAVHQPRRSGPRPPPVRGRPGPLRRPGGRRWAQGLTAPGSQSVAPRGSGKRPPPRRRWGSARA